MDNYIEVRGLTAAYDGKAVVHSVDLAVARGEHVSLLGPSGCGKTTIMRCIAGLETPIAGEIVIDGVCVFSSRAQINVPTERRNLAMVFQSYAIWPHMTVAQNVAYGLRIRGRSRAEQRESVQQALAMVGMENYGDRASVDLSGGQQQRVALARSYACQPKVILLDEPLSNLDARLRVRMREEMKDLQRQLGVTTLYVTHDQEEAMAMSDRILVMREGRVEQEGPPLDIYDAPRSRFVADFIGAANVLSGYCDDVGDEATIRINDAAVQFDGAACDVPPASDGRVHVAIRAVYPELSRVPVPGRQNEWPATIRRRVLLGDVVAYTIAWPGGELRVQDFPKQLYEQGECVYLHLPRNRVVPIICN